MIELLAIRFGEWLAIEFDSVEEAEAAAESAYDEYPGPYAPEAIFVDGKLHSKFDVGLARLVDYPTTTEQIYATAKKVSD